MAIFHLDFKIVKRSEGMTSVAKAAYHARTRITDDRIGQVFDFSYRTDLHGHIILAPVSAPSHIIESSSALWNEVERVERQNNGQTARYFDVAIPVELNNDDKKKLVAEYCQKNFVDKGMIADIVFHDLDGKNPHAHVMLTLKTITAAGFGKKDRSWNDKKMVVQWRESWATMSNSYLEAAGSEERIDHRSLRTQCADALAQAEEAFSAEEKAFWLAKATETNRPAMQRVHRAKWNDTESQEQRAAEQALRNLQIEEAKKVYTTFSELPLEIVVDVRSFTVTHLAEPEEIVLPDYPITKEPQPVMTTSEPYRRPAVKSYRDPNKISKVGMAEKGTHVLVAPEPSKSTKLKTSSSRNTRAKNRAPMSNRKQVKPRQNGMFKRFTLLVVGFFKERFVWARRKPDTTDADHDKRIAENYVFDEVMGVYVSRSEFEKRAKFNNDQTSSREECYGDESDNDKTVRFPSRPKHEQPDIDKNMDLTPSITSKHIRKGSSSRMLPSGYTKWDTDH
ncbi:MobA/MobL family protein [Salmonella enterica]|uniref:Conjugal transfer protein n=2 Tax=Salmonella enterica I TaxID=59201 RepID=A0A3T9EKD8_SALET|nr:MULTISPECIES: MobQ family relaxase [Salmonella]EAB6690312.1 conjugal transfer protein [Salmonella enterica subsp. enterica serovar Kapemba]EBU7170572.1 conjugal transfer protein [Salmonella enterica subsp. enterica serovar Enteritidis]ECA1810951.1 conjugal transfer protein [Salmonella enterica subsp. enterica serovar Derby]EDR7496066.1 conjugal transfer protein [Salmonella enterica subsp. enterica serovar Kiambu]EDX2777912.1 conjugal transfer protein [Salmonella enterica subsp. enterica ser